MTDMWILSFYQLLTRLGFSDPIHAAIVHIPIGFVVGAFIFGWIGVVSERERITLSARHCAIAAFIFLFPVVFFGLMDWEHFYGRAWLPPIIIKVVLTGILFVLLLAALLLGYSEKVKAKWILPALYTACFATVILLGWFGARLVYGENPELTLMPYKSGYQVFVNSCKSCHPNGLNIVRGKKPIINSPKLKDNNTFIKYLRNPEGTMPPFPRTVIADHEAEELYLYITTILSKPGTLR